VKLAFQLRFAMKLPSLSDGTGRSNDNKSTMRPCFDGVGPTCCLDPTGNQTDRSLYHT
jgi:hypothetical protein